jgi:hypothetical protein
LKYFCKRFERIQKIEKKKKKKEKKYKRARGNESAQLQIRPAAQEADPEPVSLSPSLCN